MNSTKPKEGIDIFCGAGGLSLGAENAGISISLAIEKNRAAADTFAVNHPKVHILCKDIREIDPLKYVKKNPFIIFGGPPCQGFSYSNTKTRNLDNGNNTLFEEFLRFVDSLQPNWFLFENVEGITTFNGGETVRSIKNYFQEMGYKTSEKVLYASDYGVPQHRNRFIMVGNRLDINFEFPDKLDKKVTVKDAICDLPELDNGASIDSLPYKKPNSKLSTYAKKMREGSGTARQNYVSRNKDYVIERYRHVRQGQNWSAIPREMMANYRNLDNCHSGVYKRLDSNSPSIVISNYRKNMLIHPIQDRGLSVREAARLQSFPDNFIFKGTLMDIQQQIGNAVPPLLAEAIFKRIMTY